MVGLPRIAPSGPSLRNPTTYRSLRDGGWANGSKPPRPETNLAYRRIAVKDLRSYVSPMTDVKARNDDAAIHRWGTAAIVAFVLVIIGLGGAIVLKRPAIGLVAIAGFVLWFIVAEFSPEVDETE